MSSVLVTGANRGIGLGLTRHFLSDRHRDCNRERYHIGQGLNFFFILFELKALNNPKLRIVQLEVVNEDSIANAAQEVAKIVGEAGLDILVNNAGIGYPALLNGEVSKAEIINQFDVNTIAPLLIANKFYPLLKRAASKKGSAQIANISSILGSLDFAPKMPNEKRMSIYAMSKSALNMLTRRLAVEWKDDRIRATSFCPGWVRTDKGGPDAALSVDESTVPLSKLILSLTEGHNGNYYNHKGDKIAW